MTVKKPSGMLVLVALLFAGCDRTESDWKQATTANTIHGYAAFLAKHPQVEFCKYWLTAFGSGKDLLL